jgi:hypothetical protein
MSMPDQDRALIEYLGPEYLGPSGTVPATVEGLQAKEEGDKGKEEQDKEENYDVTMTEAEAPSRGESSSSAMAGPPKATIEPQR